MQPGDLFQQMRANCLEITYGYSPGVTYNKTQ